MSVAEGATHAPSHRRLSRLCDALTFRRRIRRMTPVEGGHDQRSFDRVGSSNDRGFTLIELLITVVLIGTVVMGVLAAVQTNIIASSTSRSAARVESVVVNVADRINRAPSACDYTIYAQAAVLTEQWPTSSVSLTQQHYEFVKYDESAAESGTWAPGGCANDLTAPPDLQVQRILIRVTSPDGKVTRQIEVVKSDV